MEYLDKDFGFNEHFGFYLTDVL